MIKLDKAKVLSKNQVMSSLRALATFHGTWWVWLRREEQKARKSVEFFETPMNLEDVENTFLKLTTYSESMLKQFFGKFHKYLLRLLKHSGCEEDLITMVEVSIKTTFWEQMRRCYIKPALETSTLRTMVHGDYWVNNLMFSSDNPEDPDLTVTLLDFQMLTMAHPAR